MNQPLEDSTESMIGAQKCQAAMKLLVWNVCGAGSSNLLNGIKERIRMHKPQIIALLETRVSGAIADEVFKKIGFQAIFQVEARGHQGGNWLLWNKDEVHLNLINSHSQFVTMEVCSRGTRP